MMHPYLPALIAVLAAWAALRVWQVRQLTIRYEQVRRSNNEQDRPLKG
ncbi:MAG: hypothetical protein ACO1NQ_11200 [Flavobacteriales bacterium]